MALSPQDAAQIKGGGSQKDIVDAWEQVIDTTIASKYQPKRPMVFGFPRDDRDIVSELVERYRRAGWKAEFTHGNLILRE